MSTRKRTPIGDLRWPLSEEDEALWELTRETVEPLRRAKPRHTAVSAPAAVPRRSAVPPLPPAAGMGTRAGSPPPHSARTASTDRAPELVHADRRKVRQLRTGRITIGARIDLHGMRQREAHAALRRFLLSAHAKGHRWVLVITGKGMPEGRDGDEVRGVLRRNVPRWLAEPELRKLVISIGQAAPSHGGDGALYVELRTKRSEPPHG